MINILGFTGSTYKNMSQSYKSYLGSLLAIFLEFVTNETNLITIAKFSYEDLIIFILKQVIMIGFWLIVLLPG